MVRCLNVFTVEQWFYHSWCEQSHHMPGILCMFVNSPSGVDREKRITGTCWLPVLPRRFKPQVQEKSVPQWERKEGVEEDSWHCLLNFADVVRCPHLHRHGKHAYNIPTHTLSPTHTQKQSTKVHFRKKPSHEMQLLNMLFLEVCPSHFHKLSWNYAHFGSLGKKK